MHMSTRAYVVSRKQGDRDGKPNKATGVENTHKEKKGDRKREIQRKKGEMATLWSVTPARRGGAAAVVPVFFCL